MGFDSLQMPTNTGPLILAGRSFRGTTNDYSRTIAKIVELRKIHRQIPLACPNLK
jgi:hypothetical protein